MTILALLHDGNISPEKLIGGLTVAGLCGVGFWQLAKRCLRNPPSPDPWDETVAQQVAADDAVPLCHRCLTPHADSVNFCPRCGAPVGQYTNLLPFPNLFSVGHTLRIGTSGEFKRSPVTILGIPAVWIR